MTIKKALITGIAGQDGAFLSKLLIEKKYKVYGIARSKGKNNLWRLEKLKIKKIIDTEKLKYSANLILLKIIINCLTQRTIYLIESIFCRLMI